MYRLFFIVLSFILSMHSIANDDEINQERILNQLNYLHDCEQTIYKFMCLNQNVNNEDTCSEYGITGCDLRLIYTDISGSWLPTATQSTAKVAALQNTQNIASSNAAIQAANASAMAAAQASAMAASQAAMAAQAASTAAMAASQAGNAAMHAAPPPM